MHRRRALAVALLFVVTVIAGGSLSPTSSVAASPVETMVMNFGNQILIILRNNGSASQQKKQFNSVFLDNADIGAIAKFTLGKYARIIKSAEFEEFRILLSRYITQLFVVHLRGTQSIGLEVLRATQQKNSYFVKSVINIRKVPGFSDAPIPVKWRVHKNKQGEFKLFDINIGGFWLALEQRSSFVKIISQNNGKISALLSHLKKEVGDNN